jgi:long-chain acyl-CoA synthetase
LTAALDDISAAEILAALPKRISKVIVSHIANRPSDLAFVEGGRSWSYREFGRAVAAAEEDLTRFGIRPGDRVLLVSENSVALGALIFGRAKSMRFIGTVGREGFLSRLKYRRTPPLT